MMNKEKTELRYFPDPVLRSKCRRVTAFGEELRDLLNRLDKVMRSQRHGIGIAAPQIGSRLAVAIVDVSPRIPGAGRHVFVNPVIVARGPEMISREGCMSLPDYTADLRRYEWVRVRWQDEKGKVHEKKMEGIEGICAQHEIDHLEGRLFLDRVACLRTDMYPRGLKGRKR